MSARCIVVAGAGDVGGRLATLRLASGDDVVALRRSEGEPVPGLHRVRANLASGEGLARLPREVEAIVFCAAPDQRDEAAYRALYHDGLRRLLDHCRAPRVLFVSSTAVYGADDGHWVDEATPADSEAFNGRVLRQAEQVLASRDGGVCLRLSGLYGPGREAMLRKARAGTPGEPRWTNRLHVQDAAAALSHLLDLAHPLPLYLGSDDQPALESEVLAWVREREGLAPVAPASGPECGRRVGNRRLRASGWRPTYPDYRSGYAELLARAGQATNQGDCND
ncbi:MAG: NAD-dependent epimerase/dehydratase family protein [Arenimonas sp.]|nr:NAD-dependent epimerase/dehydratase family protein [Arenimonas sp.]